MIPQCCFRMRSELGSVLILETGFTKNSEGNIETQKQIDTSNTVPQFVCL